MANQANIALKAAKVEEVQEMIKNSAAVVVVDYRGYSVEQDTELRSNMRNEGVKYVVLKNGIVERAAKGAGVDEQFVELLKGPSAFAFGADDPVAPARILRDFIKKTKIGELKGGLVDGNFSDVKQLEALADLPPRDVLIARMLGSMKSPITKLAIALNQIKEKMEKGEPLTAAAPAEEAAPEAAPEAAATEAPAAEAPAESAPAPEEA